MGLTVRTIARYESDRPPTGNALQRFIELARETGNRTFEESFWKHLTAGLGKPPDQDEIIGELERSAILILGHNRGRKGLLGVLHKELLKLLADTHKSPSILRYPAVLNADLSPALVSRIDYLQSVILDIEKALSPAPTRKEKA
jgi:hypothetical protein